MMPPAGATRSLEAGIDQPTYFKEKASEEMHQGTAVSQTRENTVESAEEQLTRLKVMLRKGYIEENEFIDQRAELLKDIPRLCVPVQGPEPRWLEPAIAAINFGYRCLFWLISGDQFDKKTVVTTIGGSNLSIRDRILNFQPVGPFEIMAQRAEYSSWSGLAEDIRTYFLDEAHQEHIPKLKPIPEEQEKSGELRELV